MISIGMYATLCFFFWKMCDHFWNGIVFFYFIFVSVKRDLFSKAERVRIQLGLLQAHSHNVGIKSIKIGNWSSETQTAFAIIMPSKSLCFKKIYNFFKINFIFLYTNIKKIKYFNIFLNKKYFKK